MEARYISFILMVFVLLQESTGDSTKPHIMFIMIDDLGWANVGYHKPCQGLGTVTPTLDDLAAKGIKLDRHYTYTVCSPTRSALLTGRNPIHVNPLLVQFHHNENNTVSGYSGVPLGMTMISSRLKEEAKYRTYHTGKWDVGWATNQHLPIKRGFEKSFGYLHHANDQWSFLDEEVPCARDLWRDYTPAAEKNARYCSQTNQLDGCKFEDELFVEDVLQNLDAHNPTEPMFYYYAPHSVHTPLQVPQEYYDKYWYILNKDRRYYTAMLNYMDNNINRVITKLQEKGMWSNTVLVISSDNGGPVYGGGGGIHPGAANNYPLKGGKTSNWEGGIRVNAIVSGGYVPEYVRGTTSTDLIAIEDWYATFCDLAGIKDPADAAAAAAGLPPIDSFNIWPVLMGRKDLPSRIEIPLGFCPPFDNYFYVQGVIRCTSKDNCLKLLIGEVGQSFWQGQTYPNDTSNYLEQDQMVTHCGSRGCLFDIIADPNEHVDLSSDCNRQNERFFLLDRVTYYQSTIFNVYRGPSKYLHACNVAQDVYNGNFGPFANQIDSTTQAGGVCTDSYCGM
jgi:arylsulfatase I/J